MSRFPSSGPISMQDIYDRRLTGAPSAYSFGQSLSNQGFGSQTNDVVNNLGRVENTRLGSQAANFVCAPGAGKFYYMNGSRSQLQPSTFDMGSIRGRGAIYGVIGCPYNGSFPWARLTTPNSDLSPGGTTVGDASDIFLNASGWASSTSRAAVKALGPFEYQSPSRTFRVEWAFWDTRFTTNDASYQSWANGIAGAGNLVGAYDSTVRGFYITHNDSAASTAATANRWKSLFSIKDDRSVLLSTYQPDFIYEPTTGTTLGPLTSRFVTAPGNNFTDTTGNITGVVNRPYRFEIWSWSATGVDWPLNNPSPVYGGSTNIGTFYFLG